MLLLLSADFFFKKILPETLSECHTVWVKMTSVGPDLGRA